MRGDVRAIRRVIDHVLSAELIQRVLLQVGDTLPPGGRQGEEMIITVVVVVLVGYFNGGGGCGIGGRLGLEKTPNT